MTRSIPGQILTLVIFCAAALACGPNKEERGIDPQSEVAVPIDAGELSETEKERDREFAEEMQEAEGEEPLER